MYPLYSISDLKLQKGWLYPFLHSQSFPTNTFHILFEKLSSVSWISEDSTLWTKAWEKSLIFEPLISLVCITCTAGADGGPGASPSWPPPWRGSWCTGAPPASSSRHWDPSQRTLYRYGEIYNVTYMDKLNINVRDGGVRDCCQAEYFPHQNSKWPDITFVSHLTSF